MDNEIKQFTYISIELLTSAVVMGAIILVMSITAIFMQVKEIEDSGKKMVQVQADFYPYMQKGSDLPASDVMDLIVTYARIYDFAIITKTGEKSYENVLVLDSNDSLEEWSVTKIRNVLEDKQQLYNKYRMVQILTQDGDSLLGIAFFTTPGHQANPGDPYDISVYGTGPAEITDDDYAYLKSYECFNITGKTTNK